MSLLQIAEPSQSSKPHQHKYALGIDLGTTRSLVAVVRSGKAKVLEADETQGESPADTLLPSVVYYGGLAEHDKKSQPLVGQFALDKLVEDPKNTIASAKRFMGRSLADIKFSHPYQLTTNTVVDETVADDAVADKQADVMPSFVTDSGCKSPVEVSADILSVLVQRAKNALPADSVQGAVITVPAYFDEAQREATRMSAQLAGIKVLRLLNEPTAAAVAYGLDKQSANNATGNLQGNVQDKPQNNSQTTPAKHYLIYDLGGGTFDVSILKLTDGVFEVLATGGNSALGGDDIDRLFANWLIKQAGKDPKTIDNHSKTELANLAKNYKQQLSDSQQVNVQIEVADIKLEQTVSNSDLQAIIEPVSKRTISVCEQVLRDAKLNKSELDEVVLVGGSTRMPIIQQIVENFFAKTPLCSIDPDKVVALGASQAANQLINPNEDGQLLLLDVTPLSLGLETMGGLVEIIIPRNTPIPIKKRQVFTTYKDGQNAMVIHVLQGERDTVENNRSLGRFTLSGIPPMKAGLARIEVTFSINADGQLTVTAEETTTGVQSHIDIVPSFGLSEEQQQQLLMSGYAHAKEDKESRTLRETKMEAERELLALQSALAEFASLLSDVEKTQLTEAMQAVSQAIEHDGDNLADVLAEVIEAQNQLKPISDYFASLIMNQSIQSSMACTSCSDWK